MLDAYLPAFLDFFFPHIHTDIDWSQGYEPLDKELAEIRPVEFKGKLLADKLFKVWLKNGQQTWLLIHIEVQGRGGPTFTRRVFVYNYRLMGAKKAEVISLVVLTGAQPGRTGWYETERWGCRHLFEFPAVRIADYASHWEEMEASRNPFAVVTMAQLKANATKGDNAQRYEWKRNLIFGLYRRGYQRDEILNLFRFMDWVIRLPYDLNQQVRQEVYEFERRKKMPYVTSFEQIAMKEGFTDIVQLQLEAKFGAVEDTIKSRINNLDLEKLRSLIVAIVNFQKKADLNKWLKANAAPSRATHKHK